MPNKVKIHFGFIYDENIPLTYRVLYLGMSEEEKRKVEELYAKELINNART